MKIKQLCRCAQDDDNKLYLLDEADKEGQVVRQYVNLNGRAMFPLDGMPILNEETLLAVMDVPQAKRGDWCVTRSTMSERLQMMAADAKATDGEACIGRIGIAMNGLALRLVFSQGGEKTSFVDSELLKVAGDHRDIQVWERRVDGSTVFVLLNGLVNVGCIAPTAAHWGKNEALELFKAGKVAGHVFDKWEELHAEERN